MMKIKDIYIIGVGLLLAGCSSETDVVSNDTLSGGEKTPLRIEATLGTGTDGIVTRAAGNEFASGDALLAYIRHIDNTNVVGGVPNYRSIPADQAPRLVTFTKGSAAMVDAVANDGIKETTDLTASYKSTSEATISALYWDDFSNSSTTDTDLRTENHGLQSYYGYCYNGGTPTVGLDDHADSLTKGTIRWTIVQAQSSTDIVQKQDLLWSPEQEAVTYAHSTAREASSTVDHGTLTIPYFHAMSEVTVTLTAGTGFSSDDDPLEETALTLNSMNTVVSLQAPDTTITSSGTTANITMFGETHTTGSLTRNYTAIIAPKTKLKVGDVLLNIVDVDGNNYEVKITDAMLATDKWTKNHTNAVDKGTDGGNAYILTKHGYNYHLDITVNKTEVSVRATIKDWTTVNATGTGDIVFPNDDGDDLVMDDSEIDAAFNNIDVVAVDKNKYVTDATFSLFTLVSTDHSTADSRTNDAYVYATVPKFKDNADDANDEWVNTPAIYWPNKSDSYYFRALAQYNGQTDGKNSITKVGDITGDPVDKGVSVAQGTIAGGKDILWGTSAGHKGKTSNRTYSRGDPIAPRTGDVPIAFEHAMSKITINLATPKTGTEDANAKVDLHYVKVEISGVSTTGTINIEDGVITPIANDVAIDITGSTTTGTADAAMPLSEYIVIPQTIPDGAKLRITLYSNSDLADNHIVAYYSLQLNSCLDSQETPAAVNQWAHGNHYVYTIRLEKEQITFRALIKDWEETTGSGNATLEWD